MNYSQDDLERLHISPTDIESFIPSSTYGYELPEANSQEFEKSYERLQLPNNRKLINGVRYEENSLESTTSESIKTTRENGSRAIGVELITQRSFDKNDPNPNSLQAQQVISNSPRFVPLKPENTAVTVKLGINLKVDSKPREREEFDEAPNVEIAQAYTVFGEPCQDSCSNRGYSYYWCNKKVSSDIGTWTEYDYCTSSPNITHYGDHCIDRCEERGENYYWCHKDDSLWGYCTPNKLYKKTVSYIINLLYIFLWFLIYIYIFGIIYIKRLDCS